jgi:hypothetical protein
LQKSGNSGDNSSIASPTKSHSFDDIVEVAIQKELIDHGFKDKVHVIGFKDLFFEWTLNRNDFKQKLGSLADIG